VPISETISAAKRDGVGASSPRYLICDLVALTLFAADGQLDGLLKLLSPKNGCGKRGIACPLSEQLSTPPMNDIRRNSWIDGIPEPTGPFHWTAEWNGLAFVSGVRGIDPLTGQPARDDARRLELIFEYLRRILASVGSSLEHVLSSTVYVTDMNVRPMVNNAYVKAFGSHLPTRTIVQVAALNQNDSIEISVIAAKTAAACDDRPKGSGQRNNQ
jgi:2-iminobutanoate/2-iminopropanoate deaminase